MASASNCVWPTYGQYPYCNSTLAAHFGTSYDNFCIAFILMSCSIFVIVTIQIIRIILAKGILPIDLQKLIYYGLFICCCTFIIRCADPINFKGVISIGFYAFLEELTTLLILVLFMAVIFSWVKLTRELGGWNNSDGLNPRRLRILEWISSVGFLVTSIILVEIQVLVGPTWLIRSIKLLCYIIYILIFLFIGWRHGFAIYGMLRASEVPKNNRQSVASASDPTSQTSESSASQPHSQQPSSPQPPSPQPPTTQLSPDTAIRIRTEDPPKSPGGLRGSLNQIRNSLMASREKKNKQKGERRSKLNQLLLLFFIMTIISFASIFLLASGISNSLTDQELTFKKPLDPPTSIISVFELELVQFASIYVFAFFFRTIQGRKKKYIYWLIRHHQTQT